MQAFHVLGIMSGTSLDGVDIALCYFKYDLHKWNFKILKTKTVPYDHYWLDQFQLGFKSNNESFLSNLSKEYGRYLGTLINEFKLDIKNPIDFISSHGHTIHHVPEAKYTLQIGDGKEIAKTTGIKTIHDFRSQDVELGGQGAPLVPIGDLHLFPTYKYCINFGGFSNISVKVLDKIIAFDIGPLNIVANELANRVGLQYDKEGKIGRKGNIHSELLNCLNELSYFQKKAPKSLGKEWVSKIIWPILNSFNITLEDKLRTYYQHCAVQISKVLDEGEKVLCTGGGVYNTFFLEVLNDLSNNQFVIPNQNLIEYKEAMIFGFLGTLKTLNMTNTLQSVTGATKDHSAGQIHLP